MIPASLIDQVSPSVRRALDFALSNIGVCEIPAGSNRGPEIDDWAREFGSPLGSFWCALAVGKARKEGGLWVPAHDVGSCNEWVHQARQAKLTSPTPVPGPAVVYTNDKGVDAGGSVGQLDAGPIGNLLRVEPAVLATER